MQFSILLVGEISFSVESDITFGGKDAVLHHICLQGYYFLTQSCRKVLEQLSMTESSTATSSSAGSSSSAAPSPVPLPVPGKKTQLKNRGRLQAPPPKPSKVARQ